MATEQIDKAVNAEVHANVEAVANDAARQVDEANRNAEAIARAAIQTDHVARLNSLEGNISTWREETNQRIAATKAELIAELSALIPPPSPPPPPPIVETSLEKVEPTEQNGLGKQDEQTSKEEKQSASPPSQPARKRVLL